jgi:hypothetical protein
LRNYFLANPVSGDDGNTFLRGLCCVHGRKVNTSRAE